MFLPLPRPGYDQLSLPVEIREKCRQVLAKYSLHFRVQRLSLPGLPFIGKGWLLVEALCGKAKRSECNPNPASLCSILSQKVVIVNPM